ncbi:MAG: hypothetical protein IT362_05325 [Deltaproteobacteria bacterium]|nr:hypothetical protein [Deltaproteobacteria bacterium]
MNRFQDQISREWELLVVKRIKAVRNGYWLEAITLSYICLELRLRILLSTNALGKKIPVEHEKIIKQKYLMSLANLAKENGFISEDIWERIKKFNSLRKKAIHGLIQGEIGYDDLREPCLEIDRLTSDIQDCWLKITFGPVESFEEYKKKNKELD